MQIKIHHSYRDVIAVCDSNLIGKKYEEGKRQLDIRESFYKGEEINEKDLIKLLISQAKEDSTFNIVGEESIKAALEAGVIVKSGILKVQNVPFALTLI